MTDDSAPILAPVPGGFSVRISYGNRQRRRFTIRVEDRTLAESRARTLVALGLLLGNSGRTSEAPIVLKKAAQQATERAFREAVEFGEKLCSNSPKAQRLIVARTMTFRELGEDWTSGRLHRRYPDQIPLKRTADDDESRFKNYVYPIVGSKPVASVTLEDAEEVMRRLPGTLAPLTRRAIGASVARLLKLAVYPLKLITASPIPPGFLPKRGVRKALAYLYPDEDRRLLASTEVPFSFRLLWGFLTREGMREGEAIGLTWADLDLVRGFVRLDKNKTDDPRAWALAPGTAAALNAYRDRMRPYAQPDDQVFLDPHGRPHSKFGMAMLLRSHLQAIGLKKERPELFESTPERRQIRVHDLRGTFVTVALANGRTEAWISDRTGHRSSEMIRRYQRTARSFSELKLGDLDPLVEALPELVSNAASFVGCGHDVDTKLRNSIKTGRPQRDLKQSPRDPSLPVGVNSAPADAPEHPSEPGVHTSEPRCGHETEARVHTLDSVEAALGDALQRAAMAGAWDAVQALTAELRARREARAGIVSLEAERARRGERKP